MDVSLFESVGILPQRLCVVCTKVPMNVIQYGTECECEFTFACKECLDGINVCPCCKKGAITSKFPDRFVQNQHRNYIITCPKCDWNGKAGDFNGHDCPTECKFCKKITKFQHECDWKLDCPNRDEGCTCSLEEPLTKRWVSKHIATAKWSKDAGYQDDMPEVLALITQIEDLRTKLTALEKKYNVTSQIISEKDSEDRGFRLSLLENGTYDGVMIWKIPQLAQRLLDAASGKYTSIFSLPFYSARYGYKLCLRLYLRGDGIGKDTHLSLFFVVMKGEFDDVLKWPFMNRINLTLMSPNDDVKPIIDSFMPDPLSTSFKKPKTDMNVASGCPMFCKREELHKYTVNDTIYIKVVVVK